MATNDNDYISIVDETDRKSTLQITDDGLQVIGVLPHGTIFEPSSIEDAEKLIEYLEDYIENSDETEETED